MIVIVLFSFLCYWHVAFPSPPRVYQQYFLDRHYLGTTSACPCPACNVPLLMQALLIVLGPFLRSILFQLNAFASWKMAQYLGPKARKRRLGQGHTSKVVTIQTDPNVFPMTMATGGGGGRKWEKGTPSSQKEYGPQ
jgi:hypothetical protein